MNTQTQYRFGALATILTAVGVTVANLIYFFGNVNTVFYIWWSTCIYMLWVFAYITLFAAQAKRGSVFVFTGFVMLIIGTIFAIVQNTSQGMVVNGFVTEAQMEATKNASVATVNAISLWTTVLGSVLFGFGTFRAGVFPRWPGILMILMGVLLIFNENTVAFPIYAVLLTITMGWFGWALWKYANALSA
jgi:hypothetical protein